MSTSIDSRIVTMKFDNTSFQKGVGSTLDLLSKLKTATAGIGSKVFQPIQDGASKLNLSSVGGQADGVSHRLTAMGVAGVTAIATIAHALTNQALNLGKSLTIAPITEGLSEYETNLNSIQTIMANTGLEGERGLGKVNRALQELNRYSDQTIYNFSEMARNIGTFTAAGIDLDTSTAAIKGIANLAAVSGSNSQQASTAMYQLSQALSAGRVSLMDWNSVVNAGMGGQVFRDSLIETAKVHGIAVDEMIKKAGSFRDSLQEGWITDEVLTETLAKFTGDLSEQQLKSMGYTEEQIKGIVKMGKTATDAATKVKTMSQLINTLQEAATSGWAKSWQLIFGDFEEAKAMFTSANNVLGGFIGAFSKARNQMLKRWNELGGREVLIDAISNAFHALLRVLRPVRNAFRQIFPATTGDELFGLTRKLRDFTKSLLITKPTMRDIRNIFRALFSVIGLGVDVIKGVLRYFGDLIGLLVGNSGGLIDFTASLAQIVYQISELARAGVNKFFDGLISGRNAALQPILEVISDILAKLGEWVRIGLKESMEQAGKAVAKISGYLREMTPYLQDAKDFIVEMSGVVQDKLLAAFEKLKPILADVRDFIVKMFNSVKDSISGMSFDGLSFSGFGDLFNWDPSTTEGIKSGAETVRTSIASIIPSADGAEKGLSSFQNFLTGFGGFLATVGGLISKLAGAIWDDVSATINGTGGPTILGNLRDIVIGILENIKGFIEGLSFGEIVVAFTTFLTAGIGAAIMRFIWQIGGFFKDMRNILGSFGDIIDGVAGNLKSMQNNVRADSIQKIAIALAVLAAALWVISTIDGADLAKSLTAVTAMMFALVFALKMLEKSLPEEGSIKSTLKMAGVAVVILALAGAMLLLAGALKIMATLSIEEIGKGLLAMAGALGFIVGATMAMQKFGGEKSILSAAFAVGVLAFSLMALAASLKLYSMLDTAMLAEGGLKVAGMLAAIGLAMRALPEKSLISGAAAIFILSIAMSAMGAAFHLFARLSAGDSVQALLTMAGALILFALAGKALMGTAPAAGALLLFATAMAVLVPPLLKLGEADLWTIVKGLLAMAAGLAILGVVGTVASIGLLALGVAMALLGAGLFLAGTGIGLFASGIAALAVAGSAAYAVLESVIRDFLEDLPEFIQMFGNSIREVANQIRQSGPAFIRAGSAIVGAFLKSVIKNVPLAGKAFRVIIAEALKTLRKAVPDMIRTGFVILDAFLGGLLKNIRSITNTAVKIIVQFVNGIADNADRIVKAGERALGKFVGAILGAARDKASDLKDAAWGMAAELVNGLVQGLENKWQDILNTVANLAAKLPGPVKKFFGIASPSKLMMQYGGWIAEGLAIGIGDGTDGVVKKADGMGRGAMETLKASMAKIPKALDADIDWNPTVTPILDLSSMTREASRMSSLLATTPIHAEASYSAASSLSRAAEASREAALESSSIGGPQVVKFEQNNYSPKALSAVEIYRNTRNQISLAEEALTKR